jgi:hypothetical protein
LPPPLVPPPTKDEIEAFSGALARCVRDKSISYLDALVDVCSRNNIEPEVAATLLDPIMRERIQQEAEDLNFMKVKRQRLPI